MLGSIVKPRETPQKPGNVAIAVALGLYEVISPIMHLHTDCLCSTVSDRLLRLAIAWQQGDPGKGSGVPYVTNDEQAEMRAVTVVQSIAMAA